MKKWIVCVVVLFLCTLSGTYAKSAETTDESLPVWDIAKAKPLPYSAVKADKDHRASINRTKLTVRIVLATKAANGKVSQLAASDKVTKEELAATVIAAAKYYAQKTGADFVGIALDSQFGAGYGACQLGVADYAPDGKGVSGKDNWTWQQVQVAETGLSQKELTMQRLWGQMRGQYQTAEGTDEKALSRAIAKKMKIKAAEVTLPYKMLMNVPLELAENVSAVPGLEQ